MWQDEGGSRGPERVGIEVGNTQIINIYHHRENSMDIASIKDEIQENRRKGWVCAGNFNCHHSLWDRNGREPAGRRR
jgi:cytosine/adenosine deaminase-related metal-dependent hydrolase